MYLDNQIRNIDSEFIALVEAKQATQVIFKIHLVLQVPGQNVNHFLDFLYKELDARFNEPLEDDGSSDGDFFVKAYNKFMDSHKDLSQEDIKLYDAVYRLVYATGLWCVVILSVLDCMICHERMNHETNIIMEQI